jgi:type IV pilus assembly protein PilM
MLSFVQGWLSPKVNPIGIDFGSDCLRLAQVQWTGEEYKMIAAASADVPAQARKDSAARLAFFVETTRDLVSQGNFKGRQAVLALPAAAMFVRHLRMAKMDDEALKKALPWELRGKLPIDPSHAVLRHIVAGEVYQEQDPKDEIIAIAAARELVNQLLSAASRARLDVVGMNVEPKALIDCFAHVYRRKADATTTVCYVDIGCTASRAIIARGQEMLFARVIPVGGDHFSRAVADAMKISLEEARILRVKLCVNQMPVEESRDKTEVREAAPAGGIGLIKSALKVVGRVSNGNGAQEAPEVPNVAGAAAEQTKIVEKACQEPLSRLIEELNLCRRYHESTFTAKPLERLIFVGGEARQRSLCQQVAKEMALAAQIGDPMVRMGRISDIGVESGMDRRQPQPAWAVVIGLSMGPRPETAGAPVQREELVLRA